LLFFFFFFFNISWFFFFFFFFQAEDGIRDLYVTGVQTCALPISRGAGARGSADPWRLLRRRCSLSQASEIARPRGRGERSLLCGRPPAGAPLRAADEARADGSRNRRGRARAAPRRVARAYGRHQGTGRGALIRIGRGPPRVKLCRTVRELCRPGG